MFKGLMTNLIVLKRTSSTMRTVTISNTKRLAGRYVPPDQVFALRPDLTVYYLLVRQPVYDR